MSCRSFQPFIRSTARILGILTGDCYIEVKEHVFVIDSSQCLFVSLLEEQIPQRIRKMKTFFKDVELRPTNNLPPVPSKKTILVRDESKEGNDELSSKETNSTRRAKNGNLSFGHIIIRHYDRTVSDNPAVSTGCAIGLDWRFRKQNTTTLSTITNTNGQVQEGLIQN